MNDTAQPGAERRSWYQSHRFPLIPIIRSRAPDQWNTFQWSFHWLFLHIWSLDSFGFEIELTLDDTGGRIGVILPYLRIIIRLFPLPESWHQRLWRKARAA